MSDDIYLREKAREALRLGRLPNRPPDHIWGGPSTGGHCAVCREAMQRGAIELEIEFVGDDRRGRASHPVHVRCFTALESERQAARDSSVRGGDAGALDAD